MIYHHQNIVSPNQQWIETNIKIKTFIPSHLWTFIFSWIPMYERWGWGSSFLRHWKRCFRYPRGRFSSTGPLGYWVRPLSYYGRPRFFHKVTHPPSTIHFFHKEKDVSFYLYRIWMTCYFHNEHNFIYEYECRFQPTFPLPTPLRWGHVEFRQHEYSFHELWISCLWTITYNASLLLSEKEVYSQSFQHALKWIESSFPDDSVTVTQEENRICLYWVMFSHISIIPLLPPDDIPPTSGWYGFSQLISRFGELTQQPFFPWITI